MTADLQATLVPPIAFRSGRLEAYGQSMPKDDVGGDLADLVSDGRDVIAYVADVSGHGLRAGVLMGMIKTAVRYGLLLRQPLPQLLEGLNRVLPAVKNPNMFATLAALRFDGFRQAEYISAGHVALLQYRAVSGRVIRHAQSQFPLGLFPRAAYSSSRIPYDPGDLFVLVTDGIVETGECPDAEAGLAQLGEIIRQHAHRPLARIVEAVCDELPPLRDDDQTILLLRAGEGDEGDAPSAEFEESLEVRWRRMLDELAEELADE